MLKCSHLFKIRLCSVPGQPFAGHRLHSWSLTRPDTPGAPSLWLQGLSQCLCFWAKVTFPTETCSHTRADQLVCFSFSVVFHLFPLFGAPAALCPVGATSSTQRSDAGTGNTHTSTLLRRSGRSEASSGFQQWLLAEGSQLLQPPLFSERNLGLPCRFSLISIPHATLWMRKPNSQQCNSERFHNGSKS